MKARIYDSSGDYIEVSAESDSSEVRLEIALEASSDDPADPASAFAMFDLESAKAFRDAYDRGIQIAEAAAEQAEG